MATQSTPDRRSFRRGSHAGCGDPLLSEDDLLERFTGLSVTPETFRAIRRRREELNRSSAVVADLLERAGVTAAGARFAAVGLVTGQSAEVVSYRAVQFIPAVAARDRAQIAAALCYHLQNQPCGRIISLVVTTKGRCKVTELRGAIAALGRRISRWSSHTKARWGIDVLLRVTEFTIDSSVDPSGPAYFVHAHIIALVPNAWLAPGDEMLAECLTWSKRALKVEVLDHDVVHDREAMVRYCLKPLFMSGHGYPGQLPRTPDEAAALFEALPNARLVQPLGSFKEFAGRLKADGLKVVRRVDVEGSPYELVRRRTRPAGHKPMEHPSKGARAENRVLSVTSPVPLHTRYREPVAIVEGYDPLTFAPPARIGDVNTADLPAIWRRNGAPEPDAALAETSGIAPGDPDADARRKPTARTPLHGVLSRSPIVHPASANGLSSARSAPPRSAPRPIHPPPGWGGGRGNRDSTPGVLP